MSFTFLKNFRNVTTCSKILAYNIVEQTITTTYDIWPKVSSCCKSLLHYIVSQNFTKTHYISAVKVTTCCKMLAHRKNVASCLFCLFGFSQLLIFTVAWWFLFTLPDNEQVDEQRCFGRPFAVLESFRKQQVLFSIQRLKATFHFHELMFDSKSVRQITLRPKIWPEYKDGKYSLSIWF